MANAKNSLWIAVVDNASDSNSTAINLPRIQSVPIDDNELQVNAVHQHDQHHDALRPTTNSVQQDQLSEVSFNTLTPSPKAQPIDLDDEETDDSVAPSAINVDSDARILSNELKTIMEVCPSNLKWFIHTLSYIRDLSSTKRLNRLVRLWYRIQELDGFRDVDGRNNEHKLSPILRPTFFDSWMQTHRQLKRKTVPDINLHVFLGEFSLWWSSLQPGWRTTLHTEPFTKDSPALSDWSALCRTGPNGVALIVLSLAWMSSYIRSDHPLFSTYFKYVEDTTWAFGQIVEWIKRGRPVGSTGALKRKLDSTEAFSTSPSKAPNRSTVSPSPFPRPSKTVKRSANSTSSLAKSFKRPRV